MYSGTLLLFCLFFSFFFMFCLKKMEPHHVSSSFVSHLIYVHVLYFSVQQPVHSSSGIYLTYQIQQTAAEDLGRVLCCALRNFACEATMGAAQSSTAGLTCLENPPKK